MRTHVEMVLKQISHGVKAKQLARGKQRPGRLLTYEWFKLPQRHKWLSKLTHESVHMDTLLSSLPSISLSDFFFFSRQKRTGSQILATGPHGLMVRTWCSHHLCHGFIPHQGTKVLLQAAVYCKLLLSAVCLESASLSNSLLLLPAFLRGKNKQVCSIFSKVSVNYITCLVQIVLSLKN